MNGHLRWSMWRCSRDPGARRRLIADGDIVSARYPNRRRRSQSLASPLRSGNGLQQERLPGDRQGSAANGLHLHHNTTLSLGPTSRSPTLPDRVQSRQATIAFETHLLKGTFMFISARRQAQAGCRHIQKPSPPSASVAPRFLVEVVEYRLARRVAARLLASCVQALTGCPLPTTRPCHR